MIIYTSKGKRQIKKGEKENVKGQIGVNKTYYQATAGLINLQYMRTAIVFAFVFVFVFVFVFHFSKKPVLQINAPYNREV